MAPLPKTSFMSAYYSSMARNVAKALNEASPIPIIDTKLHSHSNSILKMNQWAGTMYIWQSYQHFFCVRKTNEC